MLLARSIGMEAKCQVCPKRLPVGASVKYIVSYI